MAYKEYKRPSIDLDAKPKTWANRYPHDIIAGSIIPECGEVVEVYYSEGEIYGACHIKFISGDVKYFNYEPIFCFQ